jgi:hypothetical protein
VMAEALRTCQKANLPDKSGQEGAQHFMLI